MATVKKLKTTRWYLPDPQDRKQRIEVKAKTPGAKKVTKLGSTYFVVWKESGKTRREATGLEDKDSAQAYLVKWTTARDQGQMGLIDPYKKHLDRSIIEHVNEYLKTMKDGTHKKEVTRVIHHVIKDMKTLRDLTASKINDYLTAHPAGTGTRIKHRVYMSGFTTWLFTLSRIPANIIDRVPMPTARGEEPPTRTRRAYTIAELRSLLQSSREYPAAARTINRGGRPRRDGTPAQNRHPVVLSEEYRDELERQGKERELVYRALLATGLRRGELSRVTVSMFDGTTFAIPKQLLKVKPRRITHLVFNVPSTLATDLQAHVKEKKPGDKVFWVPSAPNMTREHQARLKHAGITYETDAGFADTHALRTTANHILKRKKIKKHIRQRFMRHGPADITSKDYDPDNKRVDTMTPKVARIMSALDRHIIAPPEAPPAPPA